ncbi:MAG: PEP/pyruvate-binding domain-containing protein [Burkholderia gladioli]
MTLLTRQSTADDIGRYAGNKARSLYLLGQAGVEVPPWAVIGADTLRRFLARCGAEALIALPLAGLDPQALQARSDAIVACLCEAELDADTLAEIGAASACIGDHPVAVRSSGVEEDTRDFSFARQFDSYLDVRGVDAIQHHVRRCWASTYSMRSLAYHQQRGMSLADASMAVIVQRLIPAQVSDVAFTANPSSGDAGELVVSAVYGLGEGLVSGAVDADTIVVSRKTGQTLNVTLGEKLERHDGKQLVEVDAALRERLALEPGMLDELVRQALRIEQAFDAYQDIEWCVADERLWILQARPITTPVHCAEDGTLQTWDNSNIVENYPGVTTELTFTFTRHVYSTVFLEFCRRIGIPRRELAGMEGFIRAVLGYFDGRVYYNLLHWYKLASLAPFQNLGRKMLESRWA